MVVNFGLGKEVIAVASAVEKGNQKPAMRHKNGQKDRQCSGYLFGGYGRLLYNSVSKFNLNSDKKSNYFTTFTVILHAQ